MKNKKNKTNSKQKGGQSRRTSKDVDVIFTEIDIFEVDNTNENKKVTNSE